MLEEKPVIIQGDGTSLWTLTFNTNFAIGYTGLMGNRHGIGEAFQITGNETLTWNQIYHWGTGSVQGRNLILFMTFPGKLEYDDTALM